MNLWVNRMYPKYRAVKTPAARQIALQMSAAVTRQNTAIQNQTTALQTHNQSIRNVTGAQTWQSVQNRVQNTHQTVQHGDTIAPQTVTYQTTVQVEMVNHNQIHGEQDMRRLADTLRDALEKTLSASGEGVFA